MNHSIIRRTLSKLLLIEAALMVVPLVVAMIYQEEAKVFRALLITMGLLTLIGLFGSLINPKTEKIYAKEGMLIVSLCWVLWSFFGALPFVFSGQIPSLVDAFFEVSSGFTTTGATILPDVGVLSPSLLFWRSFTHLIGGMGVLVFALALLNNEKNSHLEIMRAEVPGPVFGKLVSRLKDTAQILYVIYLSLFAILTLLLYWAGMPFFDSLIISMGTAGTGGFAVYNDSIAHYNSSLITGIVTVGMLVFGVNFSLYYLLLLKKIKLFFKDEELRAYLIVIFGSAALLFLNIGGLFASSGKALEVIFFQIASLLSSTGFGLLDISSWPMFSQMILLMLMFIGGMAGSTAGGFKVMRVLILAKIIRLQTLQNLYPNRIMTVHVNDRTLDKGTQHSIMKYFVVYVALFIGLVFVLSLDSNNFLVVISASTSIFNNIGPILGTTETFAFFSPFSKLVMSFMMIAGRLEIFPLLLLFSKKAWSKY
ncbi:TrkH family potassium uptake protein [Streptococcus sp. E29BA]|uniref:TrkH family potassium uptake protein n=1 Tax=Streptococcus sp. E29BA TaxID=3278716 RepID=UPI00359D04B1